MSGAAGDARRPGETAFDVELHRTGVTLHVPADRTLLSVVEEVLPEVAYSCARGYCGTCETAVLAGTPDHRDHRPGPHEVDGRPTMMICVGRSRSPLLVLDL
ncbi:2Fe-2S iron-sulfur cluster-binding protein [Streptomyces sp. NPDC059740]|uniref:2Fe-2S iron-sulfur cluster-binding protein n=1 Tax=Streptomyces sp. NPDC059740 TaxID=3346926 RepID=UPI0036627AC9